MPFNFQDIFKSSFLENVSTISVLDMALALVLSFAVGLFIIKITSLYIKSAMQA